MAAASALLLRSRTSIRSFRTPLNSLTSEMVASSRRSCWCASRLTTMSSSVCLLSMLPLHSAIASVRLKSVLSAESQSWGKVPQGVCMPFDCMW